MTTLLSALPIVLQVAHVSSKHVLELRKTCRSAKESVAQASWNLSLKVPLARLSRKIDWIINGRYALHVKYFSDEPSSAMLDDYVERVVRYDGPATNATFVNAYSCTYRKLYEHTVITACQKLRYLIIYADGFL